MNNTPNFLPVPQIKYTQKTPILGEFEVSLHASLVQSKMQEAFGRLQKKAKLPGFREGKVPLDLVRKKYHEDVLHDVFNQVVNETYRTAAAEHKVRMASDPYITQTNLNEWKDGAELKYTAQVDLIPEVSVKKYKGLPVSKKEGKIQDEDVELVLKNLLEPKAELVNLDANAKVAKGNSVIIDFEGKLGGKAVTDASGKNFLLEVGEQNAVEDFQNGLLGMKAGESKDIEVNYPADYKNPQVAGQKVVYSVTLHEIKQKNYPELTDEIAKELQAESAADLRAKIRKSLEDELAAEQTQQMQEDVLLAFLEANPAEVPPSLVQRQLQAILADVADLLRKQRFSDNLIQDYLRKHSEDFKKRAEREVKLALLLPKVVEAEKITATEEDFKNFFQDLARQSGQKAEGVEKFYSENKGRKDELVSELQRRKAMELMLASAKAK